MRAAIDADYSSRLILAEANQWPADVRPYFGDGDECHMAFHFPLMPRIYMALRQEDRLPITDIMAQTPPIPDNCQWALFLRNHDELTLEMVTDDERDYMYFAYSADPRMRVNVGIRRRLAPLMDYNRRRIELLNSLLLSFPGTPILYYGDEIGMGDNIYLGDRNGVRTPMQWTSDRNAGFSKCDPARLYLPVVMDPISGYQAVNVEAQLSDPSSLLHWTRNMIALRKLFQVFGRGTLTFLNPANRKILAYLRDLDRGDGFHETILCVANLSRFAQPVSLDLSDYAGFEPVEMLGYVPFPTITREPYSLTLAPYTFFWMELQATGTASELPPELSSEAVAENETHAALPAMAASWAEFLANASAGVLEPALLDWLPRQRWFGAKTRTIESLHASNWVELAHDGTGRRVGFSANGGGDAAPLLPALFFFDVAYFGGSSETYQIPLGLGIGADLDAITAEHPESIIVRMTTAAGPAAVYDASAREDFHQELLRLIARNATLPLFDAGRSAREPVAAVPISPPVGALPAVQREADSEVSSPAPVPAPLSAQPGDAAAPPRTDGPISQSASGLRLQPRESPSAGDALPEDGRLDARASGAFLPEWATQKLPSRMNSAEQSNTSIRFGDKLFLKLFRRLQAEENPDVEMGRFLTEVANFPRIPPFLGEISLSTHGSKKTTVAMLQGMVLNQGDGWQWFLEELAGWLAKVADRPAPGVSQVPDFQHGRNSTAEDPAGAQSTLEAAALLGRRTAELHLALSRTTDLPAFAPEPMTAKDLAADAENIEARIKLTLDALKLKLTTLDDISSDAAGLLLSRRPELIRRVRSVAMLESCGQRIRIHGDYHLGQTLRTVADAKSGIDADDFVLIDFEGEPVRPIEERRRKQSPLKDVAGMMRSFAYAAYVAVDRFIAAGGGGREPLDQSELLGWTHWWQNTVSAEFLRAYADVARQNPALLPEPKAAQALLEAYLLEKALYEVLYELNHRPAWLRIPLNGILAL
jgi:maltose alpha-D-glucosyltransferase/alpha-amylase